MVYSLDSSSPDHHYFTVNANSGEIKNAKTLPGSGHDHRPYFEFKVEAKDTPPSGQAMAAKADVVVSL